MTGTSYREQHRLRVQCINHYGSYRLPSIGTAKILKLQLLEVTRTGFEPQTYYHFIAPASRRVSNYATGADIYVTLI